MLLSAMKAITKKLNMILNRTECQIRTDVSPRDPPK